MGGTAGGCFSCITSVSFDFSKCDGSGNRSSKKYILLFIQFCVLWAFPLLVCTPFVIVVLKKNTNIPQIKKIRSFFSDVKYPDLYGLVLVLCAMGLIFIPEIVYVRDIYEKNSSKSQYHV